MLRGLWPFIIGSAALGLDAYVIAGLLPSMARGLGTSEGAVGLGVAAFTGAYAIAGPLLAGAAGKRAKQSLALALVVFAVGNLITAVAPTVWVFLLARIVAGAAAGVYSPLSSAVAAQSVPPERRGRALSLVLSGLVIGTVFGVPVGLLIAQHSSWRVAIVLITVIGVIALAGIFLSRGSVVVKNIASPSVGARMRAIGTAPNLLTVAVTLLTGIASLGLYTCITALLGGTSLREHQTLGIWVWGLGGAAGVFLIGQLVDRLRNSLRITAVILALLVVSFVGLGLNPVTWLLLVALFAWGALGWSSMAPQQHTLLAANPGDGATAVASNASANYLGSAIGSALGSAMLGAGITGSALAYLAILPAGAALLVQLIRMGWHGRQREFRRTPAPN